LELTSASIFEWNSVSTVDWSQQWSGMCSIRMASKIPRPHSLRFLPVGIHQGQCYVPPLPTTLNDLTERITHVINSVDRDMLQHVWEEFSYRLDVVRSAGDGHIEHL
jgi:hypothetical protein